MGLIDGGIDNVRAFEVPGGIWADGGHVGCPRIVLVRWRCCWSNMFYQVYVNGRYAGTSIDSEQREMLVQVPTSLETPVRIEVFAVKGEDAYGDFSDEISTSASGSGRVRLSFVRGQDLPIGATACIYTDSGSGEIDYDNPLSAGPIRIWPAWQDKAGFGMSSFGRSDFGLDSAAAVGFGKGVFGRGQFGLDADVLEWISPPMSTGIYRFAVKITDERGNESGASETGQVAVIRAARPAEEVSVSSFDKETNRLVLSIS